MGYPLNSVSNDISDSTTDDGKSSFFSSERQGSGEGDKDIYEIVAPTNPDPGVTILKGYIDKGQRERLPDGVHISVLDLQDGNIMDFVPNPKTGAYVFSLIPCHEYEVKYMLEQEIFGETTFTNPCGTNYNEIKKVIMLKQWALDNSTEPK